MRRFVRPIIMLLAASLLVTSLAGCFGGFHLTRRLYQWNSQVGDRWTNTVVMWAMLIIPIYEGAGFIDFFLLNTAEFWSGENPIEMTDNSGEPQRIERDGRAYEVTVLDGRIEIVDLETGETATLRHNARNNAWTLQTGEEDHLIAQVNDSGVTLLAPDGQRVDIAR